MQYGTYYSAKRNQVPSNKMNQKPFKHIHVACAIIERDGLVLAVQRSSSMSMPLKWEFPGGKIDEGETPEECLKRELMEELSLGIAITRALPLFTHRYPTFIITLYPFVCTIKKGEMVLHEHNTARWLPPDKLPSLDWAEADYPIIDVYWKTENTSRSENEQSER
jgi:8-oxo-dGTP diphosphatase